jgi:hypothetical protein
MRTRTVGAACGMILALVTSIGNAGMILHFPFDQVDGTGPFTTPDTSGLNKTGTLQVMTNSNLVPGINGNALQFNGSSTSLDRVEIADGDPDIDKTYSEFTFAAWIKPSSAAFSPATSWIAGKMTTSNNRGWQLNLNPNNDPAGHPSEIVLTYYVSNVNSNPHDVFLGPNANIAPDTWVHLAFTFKANDVVNMYVNGALAASAPAFSAFNGSNSRPLQIGNRGSSIANSWNGLIDDVYMYDTALTQDQIIAIVPEPCALALAVIGLAITLNVRQRRMA